MAVSIVNQSDKFVTLQVTIPFTRSMLDSESAIQEAVNEVGNMATGAAPKRCSLGCYR